MQNGTATRKIPAQRADENVGSGKVASVQWLPDGTYRLAPQARDLGGQRIGCLTALRPADVQVTRAVTWLFQCDCGNRCTKTTVELKDQQTPSCGCKIRRNMSRESKFWEKVNKDSPDGCWTWLGNVNKSGYGRFVHGGRGTQEWSYAHRVAYQLLVGEISDGLSLDHHCLNKLCVNPDHLSTATLAENTRRGGHTRGLRQTHCKRGHEYTPENTSVNPKRGNGVKRCRACARLRYSAVLPPRPEGYRRPARLAASEPVPYADDYLPSFAGFDVVIVAWSL